ncbi:MAG: oxidoreductase [Ferruginibacter sp.]
MKKAILFGSSGLVGSNLLKELLDSPRYEKVSVVVRKDLGIEHPKLKILIGDYHSLLSIQADFDADDVFITLGTTKKATPDKDEYYRVDHDYPLLAAKIALEQGAKSVLVVTAVGADLNSTVFYIKTKGETERDIIALNFDHTHIFRPSMILGNREESRPLEKILSKIWPVIKPIFIGKLNRFKGIKASDIAKSMIGAAGKRSGKVNIYHWAEMNAML